MREREEGEIIPVSVEHSANWKEEEKYKVENAIDLDFETGSGTKGNTDGENFLKINLGEVKCVKQGKYLDDKGTSLATWTCTESGCKCESTYSGCSETTFTMTVSTEGGPNDLSPISDCKHGDTVKIERSTDEAWVVPEFVVIGRQGKYT